MIKNKEIFLRELAENPKLSENVIALVFAAYTDIDISSREMFFDNIIHFYNQIKDKSLSDVIKTSVEEIENEIDSWTGRDLRIKSVRLKSVRGYPDFSKPFGLDLTSDSDKPQSLIILGANASGKSSLFDAIEYTYCRSVGEALLRAYKEGTADDVRFKNYLEHFSNGVKKIFCMVETISGTFDIQEVNIPESVSTKVNPDTHFISNHDIYSKGQLDYEENIDKSFHNTIAKSMGLTELLTFEKNLKSFVLYRRATESRQLNRLSKSNEAQQNIIENNEKAIAEKEKRLEQIKQSRKVPPDELHIKEVIERLNQIKLINITVSIDNKQIINQIDEFKQAYKEYISKELKEGGFNELQFLNLGLDLIKEHDNCPFCNDSNRSIDVIISSVKKRIGQIQSLNEALQKLNKAFSLILESLNSLYQQLSSIKRTISNELDTIRGLVEFNEILQAENDFQNILADLHQAESDWHIACLRYFNPVGSHESGLIGEDPKIFPYNLMPYLTQVAIGRRKELTIFGGDYPTADGTAIRDYIHVMDLAEGHIAALNYINYKKKLLIANLSTGKGVSVLELLHAFIEASQCKIAYRILDKRPGDIAECWADPNFAQQTLCWQAKRSLTQICNDSWHWQKANPNGYSSLHFDKGN